MLLFGYVICKFFFLENLVLRSKFEKWAWGDKKHFLAILVMNHLKTNGIMLDNGDTRSLTAQEDDDADKWNLLWRPKQDNWYTRHYNLPGLM